MLVFLYLLQHFFGYKMASLDVDGLLISFDLCFEVEIGLDFGLVLG